VLLEGPRRHRRRIDAELLAIDRRVAAKARVFTTVLREQLLARSPNRAE
jgi:hypothetical protein